MTGKFKIILTAPEFAYSPTGSYGSESFKKEYNLTFRYTIACFRFLFLEELLLLSFLLHSLNLAST